MNMCHGSQNFGILTFPKYEIFLVMREHALYMLHVFDFYETCWYTTYMIRHATCQVRSPHTRMKLALPFLVPPFGQNSMDSIKMLVFNMQLVGQYNGHQFKMDPYSSWLGSVITPLTGVKPSYPFIKAVFRGCFCFLDHISGGAIG